METAPVPTSGDAADDPAIWIHPSQLELSLIIGTDKTGGGLAVYDLAGVQRQYYSSVKPNNVDLRYNFPLGSASVSLVGFSNKNGNRIGVFRVDPATRTLVNVEARPITVGFNVYGFCMYRSPDTGDTYAFISDTAGKVEQWRLFDNGAGKVDGTRIRTLTVGSVSEGCVADDVHRALYIAEENVGIWKYGAEPGDGSARTTVDTTGSGGHVRPDVEGLTIYYTSSGDGYLVASSQGVNEFVVYDRAGVNAYRATFKIASGSVDGVTGTDGIDVTNFPLGSGFPEGAFVAQDGTNTGGNQNFKLVPWGSIASAVSPNLTIDTTWDPRQAEGGNGNTPPVVSAGLNQTVTLPAAANLDGTVSDDGLPGPLTTSWSTFSGPGTVTFGNPSLVDTTASFSTSGSYTLRLTANDGALSVSDDVVVTVNSTGGPIAFETRVASSSDDAEQYVSSGAVSVTNSDLELTMESSNQAVGMRFTGVTIPQGAAIVNAWVRFKVDETGSSATSLNIRGQAADNPVTFTTSANNITSRPTTVASVNNWEPAPWTVVGQSGPAQQTPNLAAVIQEIVNRSGWASGNSLVLIVTGTGTRTAESFNGDAAGAPLLHVEYGGSGNQPPTVSAGSDQTVTLPNVANLDGTVFDDGQPVPPGALTTSWSQVSGPDTVTFGNPSLVDTTASFSTSGTYTLLLTANDGALSVSDDVVITVNAAGNQPPVVSAGPDQTITLPASANLGGAASDDGVPGPLTTSWSMFSGPGTVTFGNPSLVDTTAGFSTSGSYTLRLTANDGALSVYDDVVVTANSAGSPIIFEKRVASSSDDAEQNLSTNSVDIASTDLEMAHAASVNRAIGIRFTGVTIPQGAAIANAWVRFKVDETGSTATSLNIRGQAADNPVTFTTSANNITSRPTTVALVNNWEPAPWTVVGQSGPAQQTPNLAAVIQEIVNRSGWTSGNSLVLIITGTGTRTAESFNGDQAGAALLHVEYQ